MPFRDRTGPRGEGKLTGRGFGDCSGNRMPFPGGKGFGRGPGFGRGFGRGWGFSRPINQQVPERYIPVNYAPNYSKEQEIADLKAEKDMVEQELGEITERIGDLEKNK